MNSIIKSIPIPSSKKFTGLNLLAFFLLYAGSFYFLNIKYTEIIGFIVLFVINAIFMIYVGGEFITITNSTNLFIPLYASLAVMVGIIFHFISLIMIYMMMITMNSKYMTATGSPIDLPEPYKNKIEYFKRLMAACFTLGSLIIIILFGKRDTFNIYTSFYPLLSISKLWDTKYMWIIIFASSALIIMSSIQLANANDFLALSRKQLIVNKKTIIDNSGNKTDNSGNNM